MQRNKTLTQTGPSGQSTEQRAAHRPKEPQATKGSILEMDKKKMQQAGKAGFSIRTLEQQVNRTYLRNCGK
jgi:hypothetical protein